MFDEIFLSSGVSGREREREREREGEREKRERREREEREGRERRKRNDDHHLSKNLNILALINNSLK